MKGHVSCHQVPGDEPLKKSCSLNPIPTYLLHEYMDLIQAMTEINQFLLTGWCNPVKHAVIPPLI